MSVNYFIGVDGGGSKTRAVVVDSDGVVIGVGSAGSTNRNHYSRLDVETNLRYVLTQALKGLDIADSHVTVFLGMSGISTGSDRDDILSIANGIELLGQHKSIHVDNDSVAALTGGLGGEPGIALIAGTGSVCLGVNENGDRWLCGGWGALADDYGSAPWIGLRALHATVRAIDGRGPETELTATVFDSLDINEPRELIDRLHNRGLDRAHLGTLAPLVVQAHLNGDSTASGIVYDAARELSSLVKTTAERLFGPNPCKAIFAGGLARSGYPFESILTAQVVADTPTVTVCEPTLNPVLGSVLEALTFGGAIRTEIVIQNLRNALLPLT